MHSGFISFKVASYTAETKRLIVLSVIEDVRFELKLKFE